jgi:Tfp pilus assembly protein PilF
MSHTTVVVAIASLCIPLAAFPQGGEAERARADALKALRSSGDERPFSQDLERSKAKWPQYDREIEAGILEQQKALDEGGKAAEDLLVLFENRARMQETPPALYLYGRFLGLLNRLDQANEQFGKALRNDPYFPWAHHGMATTHALRGKLQDAVRDYRRALELNPSFIRSMEPLAACLIQLEQFEEADRVLRRLVEINPSDAQTWLTLGKLLFQRTRFTQAVDAFRKSLEKRPGHEETRKLLALAHRKANQYKDAQVVYADMLKDNPGNWGAHMGLAESFMLNGENHAAADEYQRALDVWPAGMTTVKPNDVKSRIEELRRLPPVEKRDPRMKSPHEWAEILVNSTEPERCREAIRILGTYNEFDQEVYKAFLKALKNKDMTVRVLAIKELEKRFLGAELTPLLTLFVVNDPEKQVRAMAARVLGRGEDPAAVPALVAALKDRDPYVFLEVHDALWRLTTSEMPAMLPNELTPEAMETTAKGWNAWYAENRDRYRKYEAAPK